MSVVFLYLLLLKATMMSFSGMGSLPQIRQDLVDTYRLVSDEQLSQAVLVGRATTGPMGGYVVAVGHAAAGWRGAVAGWLAMITPAFCAIPLLAAIQRMLHLARMRSLVDGIVIASATLLVTAGIRLLIDGLDQLARVF